MLASPQREPVGPASGANVLAMRSLSSAESEAEADEVACGNGASDVEEEEELMEDSEDARSPIRQVLSPRQAPRLSKPALVAMLLTAALVAGAAVAMLWPEDKASKPVEAAPVEVFGLAEAEPKVAEETAATPVSCTAPGEDCRASRCCKDANMQCYEKASFWASCRASCDPVKDAPWSCRKLWSPAQVQLGWDKAEDRAGVLLGTMSQEDKMMLVHGSPGGLGYAGFLKPQGVEVMPLKMNDGPQGYNTYQDKLAGTSTQFPCLLAVAASFDPETSRRYATAVADEFVTKGSNVLLGPDVEVSRAPLSGRSYETITGEDPFLGSQLVQPYIQAIQERGIIATVKHWLDNNQEIYRQTMDVEVSDRAQHEIYMPVFKAAIEAGAASVMCSYNKVYGEHACQNHKLLRTLLRKELGFRGFVVSDWGATHDAAASALGGLDVEMPNDKHFKDIPKLIQAGDLSQAVLDEKASHVLAAMHFVGQFDGKFPAEKAGAWGHLPASGPAHRAVALRTILDSAVLLKNEASTLPLVTKGKKIALIGNYCRRALDKSLGQGSVFSGGGSGYVATTEELTVTPFEGLRAHFKDAAEVSWSADASAGEGADVAVICAAAHSQEGWDRMNLSLPEAGGFVADLRQQQGQKKVVVLAVSPGAITTEWAAKADAVLLLFMPGEQVGEALAQLLTGAASPGGRLPISLPEVGEQRFSSKQYPGEQAVPPHKKKWGRDLVANFSEGVLVGYKWNDAMGKPAAFPFGFGLTYTEFEFHAFNVACHHGGDATVSFNVSNHGRRDGAAVPQLYVAFDSLKPALRQLRGFQKVLVPAGGEAEVAFHLTDADWSFYDEMAHHWASAPAKGDRITVSVGSSSADLHWSHALQCHSPLVHFQ
mmetsp:Transcript_81310/g.164681  ORF Transcript_81310/g.164681 Transcript_81310/m.164681 type:complete len:880 (+) Transcript_81310:58-2697(+)